MEEQQDSKERIELIGFIMRFWENEYPNRENEWYGKKFDELYDKSTAVLKVLKSNLEKKM